MTTLKQELESELAFNRDRFEKSFNDSGYNHLTENISGIITGLKIALQLLEKEGE